jgi:hypothetical protein
MTTRLAAASCLGAMLLAHPIGTLAEPPPATISTPKPVPADGTVIKPDRHIDPGIQAKTPPPSHFPMPVIKPGTTVPPAPR